VSMRLEARVKPGFSRYYRMLDPEMWYEVRREPMADMGMWIVVGDDVRDGAASHFELRTTLND
jgi:hypothetical protein